MSDRCALCAELGNATLYEFATSPGFGGFDEDQTLRHVAPIVVGDRATKLVRVCNHCARAITTTFAQQVAATLRQQPPNQPPKRTG